MQQFTDIARCDIAQQQQHNAMGPLSPVTTYPSINYTADSFCLGCKAPSMYAATLKWFNQKQHHSGEINLQKLIVECLRKMTLIGAHNYFTRFQDFLLITSSTTVR